jgi:hypothetical protein
MKCSPGKRPNNFFEGSMDYRGISCPLLDLLMGYARNAAEPER